MQRSLPALSHFTFYNSQVERAPPIIALSPSWLTYTDRINATGLVLPVVTVVVVPEVLVGPVAHILAVALQAVKIIIVASAETDRP